MAAIGLSVLAFSLYFKIKIMDIIQALVKEMEAEAVTTRKMLALVPTDKLRGNLMKKA